MTAEPKDSEAQRIAPLPRAGLPGGAREAAFDDLCRLAARLFAVPMAAIGLIDGSRLRYEAAVGLDGDGIERSAMFHDPVRDGGGVFWVEDARADPRLAGKPQVAGAPFVRFHAAAPLVVDGRVLGVLSVMDRAPRRLAADEAETLATLARSAETLIALRLREAELRAARYDREAADAEIRTQADRLAEVQRVARLGSWEYSFDDDRLAWSDEMFRILGLDPSVHVPTRALWTSLIHPDDQDRAAEVERRLRQGGILDEEIRIVRPDGEIRHVWCRAEVVTGPGARRLVGTAQDITELKRMEARLLQAESDFALAGRLARLGAWSLDPVTGKVTWSDEIYAIHEIEAGTEISIEDGLRFFAPGSREGATRALEACVRDGEPFDQENELITATGRRRFVRSIGQPVRNERGEIVGVRGAFQDITDTRLALDALRDSEARLRLITRATADTIWEHDLRTGEVWWSDEFPARLGYDPESFPPASETWRQAVHPDDRERVFAVQRAAMEGDAESWEVAYRLLRRDGTVMHVLDRAFLMRDADGRVVREVGGLTDISQRVEYEERLHQAQRLEAIGQLTGGIAHDFNNLLTVILGNAELLCERLNDDEPSRRLASMTAAAAQRGAELTGRLLTFARRQTLNPRPVDVNRLIAGMDELLRRTLGEQIEFAIAPGQGLGSAVVDPTQLESALLNLCINARDAMPGGGRLSIETANVRLDESYVAGHDDVTPGQYVMIAVSDTGSGMTPEVRAQAFEPFYTTKGPGKGSGLGLSVVYGFVKQSGGHVKIYSEPGEGTTVKLYLPRSDAPAVAPAPADQPPETGGMERILVVEDDDLVRSHVTQQVQGLGYSVVAAANGPEAIAILRSGEPFDLLFTDVVMPGGMNGREVAEEAQRLRPGLRVLFTSGYTESAIVHHGRLDRGVHLINKPYRRQDLARKLRQVLDEPVGPVGGKAGDGAGQ